MSAPLGLQYKSGGVAIAVESDTASGGWTIAGLASPFGPPADSVGDIVVSGAYSASLKARPQVSLLYAHDQYEPVGVTTVLKQTDIGLVFKARLLPTHRGEDTQVLINGGAMSGVSIGYAINHSYKQGGVRYLTSIDLWELSVVLWPAADRARLMEASADMKMLIKDAVLIAEVENLLDRGLTVGRAVAARYAAAQQRQIERSEYNGQTLAEWRAAKRHELAAIGQQLAAL